MIKSLKERIGDFKSERTTSQSAPFGYKWTSVVKITQSDVVEMAVDALERELRARAADEASDARPLVG